MRNIFILVVTLLISACSTLDSRNKPYGAIIDAGITQYKKTIKEYDVGDRKGRIVSGISISKSTTEIPLEKNLSFGIIWKISNLSDVKEIGFKYEIKHPPMRLPNGKVFTGAIEHLSKDVHDGVVTSWDGFQFVRDYELVPGEYIIIIEYKDIKLEKSFKVSM